MTAHSRGYAHPTQNEVFLSAPASARSPSRRHDPAVGMRESGSLAAILPTSTLVIVFLLFLLFLWNGSTRMTDTTSELRHVIEMSHDLGATLDPLDVGHALARHMAL